MKKIALLLALVLTCCLTLTALAEGGPAPNYTAQDFSCMNGDKTIRGQILLPLGAEGKLPTVILCHGYNTNYAQVPINYAKGIVGNGYACVMFDFCGGSSKSTSDGVGTEMSLFTEEEELKLVMDVVEDMDFVDAEQLFLLGISQGGFVTALAAADVPEKVKALVLVFPAFSAKDDAKKQFASLEEIPEDYKLMNFTIGRFYYEKLWDFDHLADITRYTGDVLIMHGTNDRLVPMSYSEEAQAAYASATLIPVEGAGHGFRDDVLAGALVHINDFLKAHTESK